jgi:hypothetical protein
LKYSLSLIRSPYEATFALVVISKRVDALAQAAIVQAERLDTMEAAQRERDRQKHEADEASAKGQKARVVNEPNFRP